MDEILEYLNNYSYELDKEIRSCKNNSKLNEFKELIKKYNDDIKSVSLSSLKEFIDIDDTLSEKFEYIMSCYDLFMSFEEVDGVKEGFLDTINRIKEMLLSKYENMKIENKRNLNISHRKYSHIGSLCSAIRAVKSGNFSTYSIERIFYFLEDKYLDLEENMKVEIAIFATKAMAGLRESYVLSKEEEKSLEDSKTDINAQVFKGELEEPKTSETNTEEQVVSNITVVMEELQDSFDDTNSSLRNDFLLLQVKIKDILKENRVYTDDIYSMCEKYNISINTFKDYLNRSDYDSLIGLFNGEISTLYLDFIKSLYDLNDCLTFSVNDKDLEFSVLYMKDTIENFNTCRECYLSSESFKNISDFNSFMSSANTIMLFAEDKDGNYTLDDTLNAGDGDEMEIKMKALCETIKTFGSLPYMSDNSSNNCEMAYSGSKKDRVGGKIDVVSKNNPMRGQNKRVLDKEFGKSYKRFRTNNQPRVGYVVLPICMENREKLSKVLNNENLLHSTSAIVFTALVHVKSGHDEYGILNDALDNSRGNISDLKKLFMDPNANIDILTNIVTENMKYAYDYMKEKTNVRGE